MKIHALCIVKNESDVIEQTLISAITWADFIYVFDNGSIDGTWEKISHLSEKYQQIVPYKQDSRPFRDSLRGEIFNSYRINSVEGDWWCRLDADEIYIDHPSDFLAQVSKKYQVVVSATFHYYLTDKDLELYQQDQSLYGDDVPVERKCRYYLNNWSEVRFFKYRKDLVWGDDMEWPSGLVNDPYPIRIRLKNFQYRSPQQVQKRIDTRLEAMSRNLFPQEGQRAWKDMLFSLDQVPYNMQYERDGKVNRQTWKDRIAESSKLYYDALNGEYVLRPDLMPDLYTMSLIWDHTPSVNNLIKRFIKRIKLYYKNFHFQHRID